MRKRRWMYAIVPALILSAGVALQGCGDDDDDELCSDAEIVADEPACEAFADDNDCASFEFTAPDTCEVDGCDCVIIDDDIFDD